MSNDITAIRQALAMSPIRSAPEDWVRVNQEAKSALDRLERQLADTREALRYYTERDEAKLASGQSAGRVAP